MQDELSQNKLYALALILKFYNMAPILATNDWRYPLMWLCIYFLLINNDAKENCLEHMKTASGEVYMYISDLLTKRTV
jgi:hypothetical protein